MNIYRVRQDLKTKSIYELPLRVVYYARVSTDKEEQKNSIIHQRSHFEDFIKSNPKWRFCGGYIDDGISGMHAEKREEFQRMMSDAKSGKFDFIVTKEISRFARNTLDSIQYTRELLSNGVCIWFQNDGINTIDDDSEFRLTIMAGVAQDEIRKLSSRVRFGHAQSIKNGVVLGNSMIYGYDKSNGKLTINEHEAKMIRFIFEKYASGWSTPKIENEIYNMGYRNHKGGKISRRVIGNIIQNDKYKGYYAGGKVKIVDMFTKKQEFIPKDEWNLFKDDGSRVPAIVDEATWEKANSIFRTRGETIKSRRTSFKNDNLFTGILICANDGASYWMKQHYVRGTEDVKWVCGYRIKNGAKSCDSFGLAESELKEIIAKLINSYEPDMEKIAMRYMEMLEKISAPCNESREKISESLSALKEKKRMLLNYRLDGLISEEEFRETGKELQNQIDGLQAKLSIRPYENCERNEMESRIRKISSELLRLRGISGSDIDRAVIQSIIKKILVKPNGERRADLKIILKDGSEATETYENTVCRSGNMFKKMIEAQERQMSAQNGTTTL